MAHLRALFVPTAAIALVFGVQFRQSEIPTPR
jgi:hypothetical protein